MVEIFLGILAAICSIITYYFVKGRIRFILPFLISILFATKPSLDEFRAEGLTYAFIKCGIILLISLFPFIILGIIATVKRVIPHVQQNSKILIRSIFLPFFVVLLIAGFSLLNAFRLKELCNNLLEKRNTSYQKFSSVLTTTSWFFRVSCSEAYSTEYLAQSCNWWSPVMSLSSCWIQNENGIGVPATQGD